MFFPWAGLFEQIKLSNAYLHYDDVPLPVGRSFMNRVQIKTKDGVKWLTIPIKKRTGTLIKDVEIDYSHKWQVKHLKFLKNNYARAIYKEDMLKIVDEIYELGFKKLADLNIAAIELIANYFEILPDIVERSSIHETTSRSSQKLLDLVKIHSADTYVTGLGALNYIDYNLFEKNQVRIEYMEYLKMPYNQNFGKFTPFVSILDLIAYEGKNGTKFLQSQSSYWKNFINEPNK